MDFQNNNQFVVGEPATTRDVRVERIFNSDMECCHATTLLEHYHLHFFVS